MIPDPSPIGAESTTSPSSAPESRVYFHPAPEQFPAAPQNPELAAFHCQLPGYAPTPLVSAPASARALGVRSVWVKDESSRLGLPAYKILGASWATYRALQAHCGSDFRWHTITDLAQQLQPHLPLTLVAATDGNHGRAVARMARWLGLGAHIVVPADMVEARRQAIVSEGARLTVIDGTYDEAVEAAARLAGPHHLVISDTAWEGYEQIPAWVIEGYATIFREIDSQLETLGEAQPDLVAVQMGVGALASAVVQRYRALGQGTQVVGVEPVRAACVLHSVEAGQLVDVPGPHDSVMAGLNCGRPSPVAWPFVSRGIGAFVAVSDTRAEEAMRLLAQDGVVSGESGAAGLAGLLDLLTGPNASEARERLGLSASSTALLLSTEGATDPEAYARIVGRR
jgi:diaminopropionate ammonia-lyase